MLTKQFVLEDSKILIKERSVFSYQEWEAKYHELGLDLVKVKSKKGLLNMVIFAFLFVATAIVTVKSFIEGSDTKMAVMLLFFTFFWATILWKSMNEYFSDHFLLYGGHKDLEFFISSPDEKTVRAFIDEIRFRTKTRLKDEYTAFDPDLTYEEQLQDLRYLKNNEVLDQEEFNQIREELRTRHLIKV